MKNTVTNIITSLVIILSIPSVSFSETVVFTQDCSDGCTDPNDKWYGINAEELRASADDNADDIDTIEGRADALEAGTSQTVGGDVTGTLANIAVSNDSHLHTTGTLGNLEDVDVSNTLTASMFVGASGNLTTAVDLGGAEVAGVLPEANVDTLVMRTSQSFVYYTHQTEAPTVSAQPCNLQDQWLEVDAYLLYICIATDTWGAGK